MPRNKTPTAAAYQTLLKSIRSTVIQAKHTIERTAVSMYWTIGRSIERYQNGFKTNTTQSGEVYRRLSKDLDIDQRTLYEAVGFYRAYPRLDQKLPLSWSHYRYLSQIPGASQRTKWERRIVREDLGVHQFQALLKDDRKEAPVVLGARLPFKRGLLYHYRFVPVRDVHTSDMTLMIDCGFENRIVPPAASSELANKYIYKSVKEEGRYALKVSRASADQIYTYAARVERVVDGDTLLVNIDCGFGLFHRERLRLRGIDAPELNTIAGKRAKAYTEKCLAQAAFVVLKTYWEDKYGRYLADIFILPGEADPHVVAEEGELLSQKLLDAGLAKVYE